MRSPSPPEVIGAVERNTEPNGRVAAVVTEIRDADRRGSLITDVPQTVRQQEFERQPFGLDVLGEPTPARRCAIAPLLEGYFIPSPLPCACAPLPDQIRPLQHLGGADLCGIDVDPLD